MSASGYIEERLKTLRCKLSPSKKAHRRHVFHTDNTSDFDNTAGGNEFVMPHHGTTQLQKYAFSANFDTKTVSYFLNQTCILWRCAD